MTNPMKQQMAQQFVEGEQFNAILTIFTEIEEETVEAVQDVADVTDGMDGIEEIPSAEDRQAVLQEMAGAVISGEFPQWYITRIAPIEHPEEAAQYVGEEIDDLVENWADNLRDQDVDGDDEELATAYVRSRFDVADLDEFEELIDWDEEKVQQTMEDVVAGGFNTAQNTARQAADIIEEDES